MAFGFFLVFFKSFLKVPMTCTVINLGQQNASIYVAVDYCSFSFSQVRGRSSVCAGLAPAVMASLWLPPWILSSCLSPLQLKSHPAAPTTACCPRRREMRTRRMKKKMMRRGYTCYPISRRTLQHPGWLRTSSTSAPHSQTTGQSRLEGVPSLLVAGSLLLRPCRLPTAA